MNTPELRGDSERREATVIFADISGFTAMSEKMDPEEVTNVINGCFETLEHVIITHGGVVNKYIGDCVMAVFGFTPVSSDPTVRAVKAALELRDALREFNRTANLPVSLDVHIGINSGPVIAGMVGGTAKREFTVLGDTVNLAARLEHASAKGQILVGPGTYAETEHEFEYRAAAPLEGSGPGEPTRIYEALGQKSVRRITRDSERRLATVLFADIIGLQSLSEHMGPDALTGVMNSCFSSLAIAVVSHGGVVDKYIGEGIMALFGVPNAIEDAPKQAINAAVDIRNRLAQFNDAQQLPVRLDVHVGVNTGLVIAGDIGGRLKRDFTVMGDAVNLAARLKGAAANGVICVGPETYRYTRGDFDFRALAPLTLKGKEHPVQAYEVLSVTRKIQRPALGRSDRMIFSEMVGRDAELARIKTHIANVVEGRGGIVNLSGEAGVGKSRLMAEVLATAEGMDATILEGRALSVGQNLGFHPFVTLLRQWAGIAEDETEASAESKLHAAIAALFPDGAGEVFPFVATLMGMRLSGVHAERLRGIEGDSLERLIVKSVRELFQAMAARRPLMLVFDDLHWADPSSIKLLESLVRLVTDHRILFINVFRPQSPDTAERILHLAREAYAPYHTEIHLEGLDPAHTDLLIRNLLNIEDLPESTRALIAKRAEGNPFYIEEVVRSLIDQGAVEYQDGRFRVTAKIDAVIIPGTIQDVIMARVDRLDESARQLLQVASVIGRSFYHRIIADVLPRERGLEEDLAALRDKQLLFQREARWSVAVGERGLAEELEYVFKHALAQETIYSSLLLKTRKELHQRVAHCIESLFDDHLPNFYGMLAYHYTRGEQLQSAYKYLCKAGERAAGSAAASEALNFFQEAARMFTRIHGDGGDPREKAALEKNIALALLNKGDLTESIPHFDQALEHLGQRVPRSPLAANVAFAFNLAGVLAQLYLRLGRRRRVDDWERERVICEILFNRARAEITSDPTRLFFDSVMAFRRFNEIDATQIDQASAIYASAATMFCYSGVSFAVARRALATAKGLIRQGNIQDVFTCASMEFIYHYLAGDWSDTYVIDEAVVEDALRHGQLWDVNTYLGLLCDRLGRQGDFAGARALLEQLADLNDAYGYAFAGTNRDGQTALLLLEQRKLADALPVAEVYHRGRQEDALKVHGLGIRAKIQVLLGESDAAQSALAAAEAITQRSREVSPWHQSAYASARLRHDVMALEEHHGRGTRSTLQRRAKRSARYALGVASKVAIPRTEVYQLVGRLSWLLGRRRQALDWWEKSVEVGARMGTRPELARTYAEAGRRLAEGNDQHTTLNGLGAAGCLAKAQALFAEIGLGWDLEDLERSRPLTRAA